MEKYIISNTALPPEQRNRFRRLRHARTYRNLKTREPEVGERGVYTVELTPSEVRDLQSDHPSNLRHLERVGPSPTPDVDVAVPSDADLRGHKADMLYEWGFTGRGIDVGVIDTGLGSGVASKFSIKAIRGEKGLTPYANSHGSKVASVAVPRKSRLVFSRAIDEEGQLNYDSSDWIAAIYWMVDTVGVHLINMSFGSYDYSQTAQDAVSHARSKNVLMQGSAGNDSVGTKRYPGAYDGATSVGSLDRFHSWARASHSNYGSWVDMWAGGVDVDTYDPSGNRVKETGTSFATPLVTYVKAALLTKGLRSIGQINTSDATRAGGDDAPSGVGGGKRLNGENGAWKMRDFCS
jgi:hypothetical protein